MKIRTGFVRNSSSSSFICYGVELHGSKENHKTIKSNAIDYINTLKLKEEEKKEWLENIEDIGSDFFELIDLISGFPGLKGCSFDADWNDEVAYLGFDAYDFVDKTPKETKTMAKKLLQKVLGKEYNVKYIQESWFNG